MLKQLRLSILLVTAAGCATPRAPELRSDVAECSLIPLDAFDEALARAAAEHREMLVLAAPAVRCCAAVGQVLTPALDVWRNDDELQTLSSRFVVVELPEDMAYSFFERCIPWTADRLEFTNPRPIPGAFRVAACGRVLARVPLDTFDARERLREMLAK